MVRAALHHAGVKFEDIRLSPTEFKTAKQNGKYQTGIPELVLPNGKVYTQSLAMLRFVGLCFWCSFRSVIGAKQYFCLAPIFGLSNSFETPWPNDGIKKKIECIFHVRVALIFLILLAFFRMLHFCASLVGVPFDA